MVNIAKFTKSDILNIHTGEVVGMSITAISDTGEKRDCGRFPESHECYGGDREVEYTPSPDVVEQMIKLFDSPNVGQFSNSTWW